MKTNSRIYIADQEGFVGSAIYKTLYAGGYRHILKPKRKLDFLDRDAVERFFRIQKPEYAFLVFQKSASIAGNIAHPATLLQENLLSASHLIHAAALARVKRVLFLGASCMYAKQATQPIREDAFLMGPVEATSKAYAIAKIAGIEMCQASEKEYGMEYIAAVPATFYGPGGHFFTENAHVLGALLGKFLHAVKHDLPEVTVWGSGRPKREFIYIDDFVRAVILLMKKAPSGIYNVGSGKEISIRALAHLIKRETGFRGKIIFDARKPDGAMRKILSSKKIMRIGWKPRTSLVSGIRKTLRWLAATT